MAANHTRAITRMLLAVAFLSVLDVMLKLLTPHYTALQVSTLRGLASLPFVLAPLIARRRLGALKIRRWRLHLLRGVLAILMMIGFTYAVRATSLSNVYTLYMVAPLLVTALSVLLLKERVSAGGWIAVLVGLMGAVCVLRPSAHGLPIAAALAALGSAASYAISYVLTRFMAASETPESMVFWFLAMLAAGCGLLAAPGWQPIVPADWLVIFGLGLSGAIGQSLIVRAFVLAPASVVAPFDYTALLWGAMFDWLIWSTHAPLATVVGAVLIVASGLYIMLRAHRDGRAVADVVPTALPADPPL
jgi:drug/metabolite transporter (DMT)-like permease